jgi:hypothetical protein
MSIKTSFASSLVVLQAVALTSVAFAAPAPANVGARFVAQAAPAGAAASEHDTAWFASYAEAKKLMLAGFFQAAATRFEALVLSAPDLGSRILATEMSTACRTWAQGGFVLTTPGNMALTAPALLQDRRTTDEIAILYTNAVLYGLYAGVVLDTWTKASSAGSVILPPLALAGLSAGVVAMIDRNTQLGYGVAQSTVSGMYIGFEEGLAWALWHEAKVPGSSQWGGRAVSTLILGTGTLGAIAGGVVGATYGTTPGRAAFMGSASMWTGLVAGMLVGGVSGHSDTALLASALALNVGAVAGGFVGADVSPSIARVRFVDLGGLCGGLLVGGLYLAAQDKHASGRSLLTATSLGVTGGLTAAWLLTRDMEPDQPRKHRDQSLAKRLLPTFAPTTDGSGFVLGVASTI